jgi:O-antigen/teichoic acid export membrane protein
MVLGTAIAGAGVLLVSVQSAMLLPLAVELRNGALALNEVLRQGLLTAAFVILVVIDASLLAFFAAQLAAGIVLLAITPIILARRQRVAPRWTRGQLRELAAVGLPVAISSVLGVVYLRLLVVLMSLLSASEDEVGYYVTSTRIVELLIGLPYILITVSLPVLTLAVEGAPERLRYITRRATEVLAVAGVLCALALAIAADPIIEILGGPEYEPAAAVLRIQSLTLVCVFIAAAWSPTLLAMGRARDLVIATTAGIVGVLTGGLVLIPLLDAEGAAIAAVAGDAVMCAVTYVLLRRAGPGRDISLRALAKVLFAAIVGAAVGIAGIGPDLVSAALACSVFIAIVFMLGLVPGELLEVVRRRREPRPGE